MARRIATFLLAFVVVLVVMLMFVENSLIFHPRKEPRDTWDPPTPGGEYVEFTSGDGTQLTGWYLPHPQPKAVVLFACGNGGNMSYWRDPFVTLNEVCDVTVMGFDYRGYGRSQGSPNEAGVYADARAARKWLAAKVKIDEKQVVLMGRSLGGGVMIELAGEGARGLVVESTFTSLPDVADRIYRPLPVRWLMRSRFNSIDKIPNYRGPLFVSHGDADSLIPLEMGKRLHDAASSTTKKFFTVPHGDHNDHQPFAYYEALAEFFKQLP